MVFFPIIATLLLMHVTFSYDHRKKRNYALLHTTSRHKNTNKVNANCKKRARQSAPSPSSILYISKYDLQAIYHPALHAVANKHESWVELNWCFDDLLIDPFIQEVSIKSRPRRYSAYWLINPTRIYILILNVEKSPFRSVNTVEQGYLLAWHWVGNYNNRWCILLSQTSK